MLSEKIFQHSHVPLSDFPKHPAHGLVHQVFAVAQQQLGNRQRVVEVGLPDEVEVARMLMRRSQSHDDLASR